MSRLTAAFNHEQEAENPTATVAMLRSRPNSTHAAARSEAKGAQGVRMAHLRLQLLLASRAHSCEPTRSRHTHPE